MEKQKEFMKQLDRKIKMIENNLEAARNELKLMIDNPRITLSHGLAREAENITKYTAQLEALYEQKEIFDVIFEEEGREGRY